MAITLGSKRYKKCSFFGAYFFSMRADYWRNFKKLRLSCYGLADEFNECIKGHNTEVFIAPGAHCDRTGCTFFVASDKNKWQLLHGMLAYFIRNLFVAQIKRNPQRVMWQGFLQFCSNFHQVNVQFSGHTQGFLQADDADGLVLRARQAHFGRHDFTVQAVLALFTVATITKFSSDGYLP